MRNNDQLNALQWWIQWHCNGQCNCSQWKWPEAHLYRQGPPHSIRIVIWILPSDTETSAATPWELMQKKYIEAKLSDLLGTKLGGNDWLALPCIWIHFWMGFWVFFSSQSVRKPPQSWRVTHWDHQIWGNLRLDFFWLLFIFHFNGNLHSCTTTDFHQMGWLLW